MATAIDVGNLESVLAESARANGVSAEVYSSNGSSHADIDAGHAGGITLSKDAERPCWISGFAHSYVIGGNSTILDELAKAGISSQVVPMGPEQDSRQVKFTFEYIHVIKAVDALFAAYKCLAPKVE